VGNRGMFRSIRDLIFRPGYMIRDYLRGMQMAYFPPFKMFFLLIALSLVVDSGLNIQGINRSKLNEAEEHEIVAGWFNSEEKQTEEGEAKRDEENYFYVGCWEYKGKGNEPELIKEPLEYEAIKVQTRNYKN